MQKRIQAVKHHYIICGLGDTGRFAVEELQKTGTPYVVVEHSEENIKKLQEHDPVFKEVLYITGDATDENTLDQAGVERARGLIASLASDKDNLVITVVARQKSPHIRIIARCTDQRFADRLMKAGANSTVSPNRIGGMRMASEALRPHVVGFLDIMHKEHGRTLRIEEIDIASGSPWVGTTLQHIDLRHRYNLLPLAIRQEDDRIVIVVTDNGVGFDPAAKANTGLGLFTVAERLRSIGGSFGIDSGRGRGTKAILSVPLGEERPAKKAGQPPDSAATKGRESGI